MLLTVLIFLIAMTVASDEFWDYEEQVNLEAFSSSTFYDILLKHSVSITTRLGHLREEVNFPWNKIPVFSDCLLKVIMNTYWMMLQI